MYEKIRKGKNTKTVASVGLVPISVYDWVPQTTPMIFRPYDAALSVTHLSMMSTYYDN